MSINDNGIMEALKENPQNGFRMLMAKYQENVYWHIRRLVVSHNDAQDASQETFVRIYRSFGNYRGDCSLRSWIYRIATNEALRIISKRRQEVVSIESETTGVNLIQGDDYIDFDDKVAVKLAEGDLRCRQSNSWHSTFGITMNSGSTKSRRLRIPRQPVSRQVIMLPKRKLSST